jgi:PleD family two-component response regulator
MRFLGKMKHGKDYTIVEEVRTFKEKNAARSGYDIEKIIESARSRQETSGRHIIRQVEGASAHPAGVPGTK